MYWYIITHTDGTRLKWDRLSTSLPLDALMQSLAANPFIAFDMRLVWSEFQNAYTASESWDANFTNQFVLRSQNIQQIIPLREDPRKNTETGERYANQATIELLFGKNYIPLFKKESWRKSLDKLRIDFRQKHKFEVPLIRFADWSHLKANEIAIRYHGIVALRKSVPGKATLSTLFQSLKQVIQNNIG